MKHAKILALAVFQSVYIFFALCLALIASPLTSRCANVSAMGIGALFVLAHLPFTASRIGLRRTAILASSAAPAFGAVSYTLLGLPPFRPSFGWPELPALQAGFVALLIGVGAALVAIAILPFVSLRLQLRAARTVAVAALGGVALVSALMLFAVSGRPAPVPQATLLGDDASLPPPRSSLPRDSVLPGQASRVIGDARVTYRADLARNACDLRVDYDGGEGARIPFPISPKSFANTSLCPALYVAHTSDDEWVVAEDGAHWARSARVFRGRPFVGGDLTAIGFPRVLGPPRRWIVAALFGLVLAVAIAFRRDRALEAKLGWVETKRGGEVVLVSPLARGGGYRGSPDLVDPRFVEPGTHAALAARVAERKVGRWLLVCAVVALFGTPLVVAIALGLGA